MRGAGGDDAGQVKLRSVPLAPLLTDKEAEPQPMASTVSASLAHKTHKAPSAGTRRPWQVLQELAVAPSD